MLDYRYWSRLLSLNRSDGGGYRYYFRQGQTDNHKIEPTGGKNQHDPLNERKGILI